MNEDQPRRLAWRCGNRVIDLTRHVAVMGIVNVTPDSFSDGNRFFEAERAIEHALELERDGAGILDIGGESTRPGAEPVSEAEELRRVLPVIEGLHGRTKAIISVDTSKTEVARRAMAAGAAIINDVTALRGDPAMTAVAAETGAGVVLMHMLDTPRTMQTNPQYQDVMGEVRAFLEKRVEAAVNAGIVPECLAIDPGIGFGKTLEHNLELVRRMCELTALQLPVLVGPSRKAFIGKILGLPPDERVEGTIAVTVACALAGARVVRVHDVAPVTRAIRMTEAVLFDA